MHDALCLEARVQHDSSKTNQARALIAWINRAVTSVTIICKHRDSSYGESNFVRWLGIQHHRKESVVAKLEESGNSCFHLGPWLLGFVSG